MFKLPIKALALLATLALAGCQRGFYAAHGNVESHGGSLGQWSERPDGCSLAPFDGLPVGSSNSLVEFAWQHGRPVIWSKHGSQDRWMQEPVNLDIERAPNGLAATLTLVQTQGPVHFDSSACTVFSVDYHPGPPVIPGGPPSLAGRLLMDCGVNGSHLTANVVFRGCVL